MAGEICGMRELLQYASVAGMAAAGLLSLWPSPVGRRWKSWNLYLPFAGLAFYWIYELTLPAEMPEAGAPFSAVVPLLLFLWVNGMAKVGLLAVLQDKSGGSRRRLKRQPQRAWQAALALPILAASAFLWYWKVRG